MKEIDMWEMHLRFFVWFCAGGVGGGEGVIYKQNDSHHKTDLAL